MKFLIFLALAFLLTKYSTAGISDTSFEGDWYLKPVLASDTAAGKIPRLRFDLKKFQFKGNTGCNRMSGAFLVKGDSLVFKEEIVTTKMKCEGYNEKAFLDHLLHTNRYKIEDGELMLMNDQTILSKWTRAPQKITTQKAR